MCSPFCLVHVTSPPQVGNNLIKFWYKLLLMPFFILALI